MNYGQHKLAVVPLKMVFLSKLLAHKVSCLDDNLSKMIFVALNKSVICSTLGLHNLKEKGEAWLDVALENQRKTLLNGVHGYFGLIFSD